MTLGELARRANEAAAQLSAEELGSEHFLLALLHPESDSAASQALRACGLHHDDLLEDISRLAKGSLWRPMGRKGDGRLLNLEAIRIHGRAEGIAAGVASPCVKPEHLLLAMIWDEASVATTVVARRNVTRERIRGELNRVDEDARRVRLPPSREWSDWQRLSPDEFERLRKELRASGKPYRFRDHESYVLLSIRAGHSPDS